MILFVALNILAVVFLIGMVMDYYRLKKHIPSDAKRDCNMLLPVIDVLFHPTLRDNPQARKIQKRAIWLFCLTLLMVNLSGWIMGKFQG